MAHIEVKYKNEDKIEEIKIQLFDNRLTEELVNYFSEEGPSYPILHGNANTYRHKYNGEVTNNVVDSWDIILDHISQLKDLGVKFLQEIPDKFDFSQDTLNYLHRCFTYATLFDNKRISVQTEEFPFTSDYTGPQISEDSLLNLTELYKVSEPINAAVHSLERFTIPTNGATALSTTYKIPSILFKSGVADDHNSFEVKWLDLVDRHVNGVLKKGHESSNYNFMEYTEQHMVCLTDTILGKSVLVSYRDNDNPSLPDCTGRLMTEGSFKIYPNRVLHDLYQSDGFISWLDKHKMNINQAPLEMAIGHVTEYSIPLESLLDKDVETISVKWVK